MKIVIDNAIPFLDSLFESYAEVVYLTGREFSAAQVRDADALIIRTRTRCDAALLEGSSVRIIATATIGCDHIDLEYCRKNGIKVTNAAGCNARAVLQWVGASLALLAKERGWSPAQRSIGVVGVGNVGSLVAKYCSEWGFRTLCCDPPRALRGDKFMGQEFMTLEEMLPKVDILTLHTPLNDSSFHLLNTQNIKLLSPNTAILNSSRGECFESAAAKSVNTHKLFIDVWEDEPNIDLDILERAVVSTPHIAGYSRQGKANGSAMAANSVAQFLNIPINAWYPDVEQNIGSEILWKDMTRSIDDYFDIERQSRALKTFPKEFEQMRNNYNYRNEYF